MPAYTKQFLSASGQTSNGQPIDVTGILPSSANIIHTGVTDNAGNQLDEVWAWAYVHEDITADRELRVIHGASTVTGVAVHHRSLHVIPHSAGPQLIIPGFIVNNAHIFTAYATVASDISIIGYVNRVT
tara:strand:+ start:556 stop:942 length:387 start_codon:yes stop_codon:yes gene_type:complete